MFADISGFTNLTETLSKIGPEGAEVIAFAINRYMELLIKSISKSGGDIFKFAGDAMIVVWPPPTSDNQQESEQELELLGRMSLQSALDIQAKLNDTFIL
jgi:adenylate cyclase 10